MSELNTPALSAVTDVAFVVIGTKSYHNIAQKIAPLTTRARSWSDSIKLWGAKVWSLANGHTLGVNAIDLSNDAYCYFTDGQKTQSQILIKK